MNVVNFDITFDNAEAVYFAGEDFCGVVGLELSDDTKINELLLEFKGGCRTHWTKHTGNARKHYSDWENYFCEQFNTKYTWGFGKLHERLLLKGRHEIPFAFILPKTLPSSFEGDYGHIRYTCKATLERPWDSDILCKRAFTVIGLEDLNECELSEKPINLSETSSVGLPLCFRTFGTISTTLSIPKSGFVVGEKLKETLIHVRNDSTKNVRFCRMTLKQNVRYTAKDFAGYSDLKKQTKDLVKVEKGFVKPDDEFLWDKDFFKFPAVVSNLSTCRIVQFEYFIELEIDGCPKFLIPIIVGAIPRLPDDIINGEMNLRCEDNEGCQLSKSSVQLREMLMNSKKFAPKFCDSFFGSVDITEEKEQAHFGEMKYTPKYPCYDL